MGAPAEPAQNSRLTGTLMDFITVLHASKNAFDPSNPNADVDDFMQDIRFLSERKRFLRKRELLGNNGRLLG